MLVVTLCDPGVAVRQVGAVGRLLRKREELVEIGNPRLHSVLRHGRGRLRIVEAADRHADIGGIGGLEKERRAASLAKASAAGIGGGKPARRTAGDREVLLARTGKRHEEIAAGLLAHAAVAEMRIAELAGNAVAHRAALTSTAMALGSAHGSLLLGR